MIFNSSPAPSFAIRGRRPQNPDIREVGCGGVGGSKLNRRRLNPKLIINVSLCVFMEKFYCFWHNVKPSHCRRLRAVQLVFGSLRVKAQVLPPPRQSRNAFAARACARAHAQRLEG